jgi:hypothetical protein
VPLMRISILSRPSSYLAAAQVLLCATLPPLSFFSSEVPRLGPQPHGRPPPRRWWGRPPP